MPDNLHIRRPLDAKRINMNQDYEVAYWTRTLGVSKAYLQFIIDIVGDSVAAVK